MRRAHEVPDRPSGLCVIGGALRADELSAAELLDPIGLGHDDRFGTVDRKAERGTAQLQSERAVGGAPRRRECVGLGRGNDPGGVHPNLTGGAVERGGVEPERMAWAAAACGLLG